MTLEQTRQLGIEFERRIQTMIPERELNKLDTETIYAYLNSYQDKYVHDIYRNLDQIQSGSKLSSHVEAVLQQMLRTQTISVDDAKDYTKDITDDNGLVIIENGRCVVYPLDPSFYMYIRSVSNVSSTFSYKNYNNNLQISILPNELVSQSEIYKVLETPHNSLRILRHPAATIGTYEEFVVDKEPLYIVEGESISPFRSGMRYTKDDIINKVKEAYPELDLDGLFPEYDEWPKFIGNTYSFVLDSRPLVIKVDDFKDIYKTLPSLSVIYDRYTTPLGIKIMYYAQPQRFDLMTSTPCELPMDVFEDIVSGAVDLYVLYVAGAEARKRQLAEARRKEEKKRRDDEDED